MDNWSGPIFHVGHWWVNRSDAEARIAKLEAEVAGLRKGLEAAKIESIYWDNDPITTPQLMKADGDVVMETSMYEHNAAIDMMLAGQGETNDH